MRRVISIIMLLMVSAVFVGCTEEPTAPPEAIAQPAMAETTAFAESKALAEAGDAEAQFRLGSMYAEGIVVPNDFTEATRWFSKASEQGHAEAMYFLGIINVRGFGTSSDIIQGYIWFCLSAKFGFDSASKDCAHFEGELTPEELTVANNRLEEMYEENQPSE